MSTTVRKHITRWVDYTIQTYCDNRAKLAIWLDTPITINFNRWTFISIVLVASISLSFILLSFVLGNLLECKVL